MAAVVTKPLCAGDVQPGKVFRTRLGRTVRILRREDKGVWLAEYTGSAATFVVVLADLESEAVVCAPVPEQAPDPQDPHDLTWRRRRRSGPGRDGKAASAGAEVDE